MTSNRSIGIDFGTTTSLVAEGSGVARPLVFPVGEQTVWLPSVIGMDDDTMVVGESAERLPLSRIKYSIKRAITHDLDEVSLPDGTLMNVDDGIRAVLRELAARARSGGLDLSEDSVRLGCPAMWTGHQRRRLLELAAGAGLPAGDHTLIDEPIAAGVAWVSHRVQTYGQSLDGQLLVFDMGGGTLDVALLDVEALPGRLPAISVLASSGIDEAGDVLDESIERHMRGKLHAKGLDADPAFGGAALDVALRHAARQAKVQLTTDLDVPVVVRAPGIDVPPSSFSREELEDAFAPQLGRASRLVWEVIRSALLTHETPLNTAEIRSLTQEALARDIKYVLLVGGMSRIPVVRRRLEEWLPDAELHLDAGVAADEAIVSGLAEPLPFDQINLHRPGFDFVLEHTGPDGSLQQETLYEAFSPFYDLGQASRQFTVYFDGIPQGPLPRSGTAVMRVQTSSGQEVVLRFKDSKATGLQVPLGHLKPKLRIYPNGRVLIVDGKRGTQEFKVDRWPAIRGSDHGELVARELNRNLKPDLSRPYMKDPLFLH